MPDDAQADALAKEIIAACGRAPDLKTVFEAIGIVCGKYLGHFYVGRTTSERIMDDVLETALWVNAKFEAMSPREAGADRQKYFVNGK